MIFLGIDAVMILRVLALDERADVERPCWRELIGLNDPGQPSNASPEHDCLAGGGEMGAHMRAFDWSGSAVGAVEGWPGSLKTTIRILLTSRYAMWMGWGPELTFFYNDAYTPTLGVKHPWALGRSAREVWAEIWGEVGPRAEAVLATGLATWDEALLLFLERSGFPEETYHTFSYSPLPDDRGVVGGMLCVVTEDTERVLSERRLDLLRELASELTGTQTQDEVWAVVDRRIAARSQDLPFTLLYLFDANGKEARLAGSTGFAAGNQAAPDVIPLGPGLAPWPAREILEGGVSVTVDDLATRFDALPTGVWDRPPRQAVLVPLARQGQERPAGFLVAGINPYRPFDAAYSGFVGLLAGQIASGLANAQAYEEERRRAEALAEIDRAKTAFFSNVSHEFRTPLTLMLGPVEDALDDRLDAAQRDRMEVVHRNALRLQKLVNTLLDFSRIEAGRVQAVYEPTDLSAFTAELASVFRSVVEKAGMRLIVDCPPLPAPVLVDHDMWEKVVLNLVSNAFKFTLEGEIEVSLQAEDDAAVLRVRDTGTGISTDQLPHIFERFHRVEGARARTHEGTGIGLALVQEFVKLQGGTVAVASEPGQGTTFTVRLPLGSAHLPSGRGEGRHAGGSTALRAGHYVGEALRWLPDARPKAPAGAEPACGEAEPTSAGSRPRVLVADDNADMRDYVCRLLADRYDVETVPDGEAALAAARRLIPDLVLTDVMMPRLDGFGLLRALRADPRTQTIPVLMLSARAGEESRVEGLEAGADDYLIKPFSARELTARVASLLELGRVRLEAAENERALRDEAEAARERTSAILESITDGFVALDARWRFTYVNAAAERIHGSTRDAILGRTLWEVLPATLGSVVEAELRRASAEQVTAAFASEFGRSGRWFEVHAYPSKGEGGGLSVYFHDATERKQAEADRERHLKRERQRSEQLRRLADVATRVSAAHDVASIMGVVAAEARGLIEAHQASIELVKGENRAEPVSHASFSEKYAPWSSRDARREGFAFYSQVGRDNRPLRLTQGELERHPAWPRFHAQGTTLPPMLGWLASPMLGRDGRKLGLIQLSEKVEGDFTGDDEAILVQLAQMASVAVENARLYRELRENDHRKDEFLAMLAHELRTPLAAIGNAVTIAGRSPRQDHIEWGMDVIDRQIRHLSRLIDDLLDVSRISRGKIELRRDTLDVTPILDNAVETIRPLLDERKHTLDLAIDRGQLWAHVDATRLEQVVTNLLTNAAKYSENGGRIWLSAAREGEALVITVRDNGVGIAPDMLPRMFDLFAQGDRSLARSEGGLGIGLTVVKRLVEMHGGTVSARSDGPGKGSDFRVRLPAAARPAEARPVPTTPEPKPLRTSRILVVDDNVDTARGMARLLKLLGHEVTTVHSGPEAIEAARSVLPEFVLLDIGLPGMDGYSVAAAIRREPCCEGSVIIAVSGYGQEEDRRRGREAGFDHHLVKPVDHSALLTLLARSR